MKTQYIPGNIICYIQDGKLVIESVNTAGSIGYGNSFNLNLITTDIVTMKVKFHKEILGSYPFPLRTYYSNNTGGYNWFWTELYANTNYEYTLETYNDAHLACTNLTPGTTYGVKYIFDEFYKV